MKNLAAFFCLAFSLQCAAQITGISVEIVMEHDGVAIPELAGHTTYRVYADVTSNTDFISAVYGNQDSPLMLGTDGVFFQDATAGNLAQNVVPALFPFFPTLEFDSWLTIGISNSDEGSSVQNTLVDAFAAFNVGDGFVVNDPGGGSWFNLLQCLTDLETCADEDLAFGGADNRVLLAQLTSTGDVHGVFNVQVFPAGDQDEEIKQTFTFSSDDADLFGCTNPAATGNEEGEGMYDPAATIDDFSCVLPCTVELLFDIGSPSCYIDNSAVLLAVEAMGAQGGADYFYLDSIGGQQGLNFGNFGPLFAGTYMVFVEDDVGCTDSIQVVIPEFEPIEVSTVSFATSCPGSNDGEVLWAASGGEAPYTYFFNGAATNSTGALGLAAGDYDVVVTDENNCSSTATVTVEAGVSGDPGCGGCTNPEACNYQPDVLFDDGSCLFFDDCGVCGGDGIPQGDCDCEGNQLDIVGICGGDCTTDFNSNGVCDDLETLGCTYPLATNFSQEATDDDGSCVFPCVGDVNQNIFDWDANGNIGIADFLQMLSVFGDVDVDSDGVWDSSDLCVDINACNYANDPSELCGYIDVLGICGGGCEADEDNDGICDDIDTCIGIEDECGICNGPGPTEVVIEDITILYDSVYLPQLEEWYVYEFGADTTFSYECLPPFSCSDPVSYQGYDYATVLIGDQCWFAENLRSESYENGDAISLNSSESDSSLVQEGAVAVFGEGVGCENSADFNACDPTLSLQEYGRLYNWYAVEDARGLCPSGWHVPTDNEWTLMIDELGGWTIAGTKLKTDYGYFGIDTGTNSSGFSGLPGGNMVDGYSQDSGRRGNWWSSSSEGAPAFQAWQRNVRDYDQAVFRSDTPSKTLLSIRCLKDSE